MKLLLITDTGESIEARCDGCRHWERKAPTFGKCICIDEDSDLANLSVDAREYGPLSIWTWPEFGCAKFERKEPA